MRMGGDGGAHWGAVWARLSSCPWDSPGQIGTSALLCRGPGPVAETLLHPQEHLSLNRDLRAAMMSLLHSQEGSTLGRKHAAQPQHCQNTFILCPDHPSGSVSPLQHRCTRAVHMGQAQRVAFGAGGVWLSFWVLSAGPELQKQSFCRGLRGCSEDVFAG